MQDAHNQDLYDEPNNSIPQHAKNNEDFDDTFNDRDSPQLVGPKKSKFAPQDPHKGNKTQRAEEGDTQSFLSR